MKNDKANKEFDKDLTKGEIHEDLMKDILCGKMEIKTEGISDEKKSKWWETGNMYIECINDVSYSGIWATKSRNWCQRFIGADGEFKFCLVFPVDELKNLIKNNNYKTFSPSGGDYGNSKGFLLPLNSLFEHYINNGGI